MNINTFEERFSEYLREGSFFKGGQLVAPHSHDANGGQINPGIGVNSSLLFNEGSVLFAGIGGSISEDNDNFFWDNTNNKLGIGINSSLDAQLHIVSLGTNTDGIIVVANTGSFGGTIKIKYNAEELVRLGFISDGPADTDKHGRFTLTSATDGTIFNFTADIDNLASYINTPAFGIGLTNSNNPFTLDTSQATNQASKEPPMLMQGVDNKERFQIRSSRASIFIGSKFNGSIGSETAATSGNFLAGFGGTGHDGSEFLTGSNAGMNIWAAETYDVASHGAYITFVTTPIGALLAVEQVRITDSGIVQPKIDDLQDFGTGSLQWKTGYFGTSVLAPLFNAATGFQVAGGATSGNVLRGNGTNFVSTQLSFSDLGGTLSHGSLGDLLVNDHTQYALVASAETITGSWVHNYAAIFNETGADVDFRIEGDTEANLFFVDASTDRIGIGRNNPDKLLHLEGTSVEARIKLTVGARNSEWGMDTIGLFFQTLESGSHIRFFPNGSELVRFTTDNLVAIGLTVPTAKCHIDQSSTTAAIPVLTLDQGDISEEMIEFVTTIGTGNAIEAVAAKVLTTTHFIKVTIPGGLTRYLEVGTIA